MPGEADCWVTVRPGGSKRHDRSRRNGAVAATSTQHSRRPSAASSTFAQVVVRTPGGRVRVRWRAMAPSGVRYVKVASTGFGPGL